jgi:peptidoglycan/LPS O-acetylase OafA/YrhL
LDGQRGYRSPVRNRYLDLLRAAAIARVIVYHLFGWPWLSILLPAMGVMFALAGSLTAASLDKRPARKVITSRLRRLLPPLWLLGLIVVPAMLYAGWRHETDPTTPFSVAKLALWIVPIGDPPGSDKGVDIWEPLWYIRAYLWFIVLSPGMYWLYRKTGWVAVALPIVMIAVLDKTGFTLPDLADAAMWDFVTFAACWILGFAHHDGRLARLRPWLVVSAAVMLGAAALYWLRGHQGDDAWDLNDVSESQALWSVAFVLLALRWQPPMGWLARARLLDRTVTFLNARAVTVYLWHNIAIAAIWPVLTLLALDDVGHWNDPVDLIATVVLTLVAVVAFGWVEDLAAKRRPEFWPTGGKRKVAPVPAAALAVEVEVAPVGVVMPRQARSEGAREPSVPAGWGTSSAVVSPTAVLPIISVVPDEPWSPVKLLAPVVSRGVGVSGASAAGPTPASAVGSGSASGSDSTSGSASTSTSTSTSTSAGVEPAEPGEAVDPWAEETPAAWFGSAGESPQA